MLGLFSNGKTREVILVWDSVMRLSEVLQVIILSCNSESFVNSAFAYKNRKFGFRILEIAPGSNYWLSPINTDFNCPQCVFLFLLIDRLHTARWQTWSITSVSIYHSTTSPSLSSCLPRTLTTSPCRAASRQCPASSC